MDKEIVLWRSGLAETFALLWAIQLAEVIILTMLRKCEDVYNSNGFPEVWHWILSTIYNDIRSIKDMMSNCIFIGLLGKQI